MGGYELVIFDCDGVLVDSERFALRLEAAGLTALGWSLSEADIIERFVGRSDAYILGEVSARLGHEVAKRWASDFQSQYHDALADVRAVDGVAEALERIEGRTCVASSSTHDHIRRVLGLTGLLSRFDGRLFSGTEVAHGKPAPDLFLLAAERLGVVPNACAVVEDSAPGVQAARAAGMAAFGYTGGVTPAARLEMPGVVLFRDMRDLPALLERP